MSAKLPGSHLDFSRHCLERMLERNISIDEVHGAIREYEQAYRSREYDELRVVYRRWDIAVVVAPLRKEILTVLYRRRDRWASQDGRPSGAVLTGAEQDQITTLLKDTLAQQTAA